MTPCTEDLIYIVRISSEASNIASMEKCFNIIDKEVEELNRRSQKLQEEYLKEIMSISDRYRYLLEQRAIVEEAVLEITSGVLRKRGLSYDLN